NHPHSDQTEQYIINALRAANALTVSLVAEIEGQVVGHIAFSPVTISGNSCDWYGFGPVSVLPDYHPDLILEGVPQENFLALPFGEEDTRGVVVFHEGFNATD
ncbi:MAG: GNAT family N-acetyltransferase, partial [Actinomycetota bacterium]